LKKKFYTGQSLAMETRTASLKNVLTYLKASVNANFFIFFSSFLLQDVYFTITFR